MESIKIPRGCRTKNVEFGGRVWTIVAVPWPRRAVGPLDAGTLACIDEELNIIMFREGPNALIDLLHEISHWSFPTLADEPVSCPSCGYKFAVTDDLRRGDGLLKEALESLGVDLSPLLDGFV